MPGGYTLFVKDVNIDRRLMKNGLEIPHDNLETVTTNGNTTTIHTSFLNPNISLNTVGNAVFGSPSNVTIDTTNRKVTFATNIAINSTLPNTSISIGNSAGQTNQQTNSVAIGIDAGKTNQGSYSIAIGNKAGISNQGNYSIAIGNESYTKEKTIVLNASDISLTAASEGGTYISPIRSDRTSSSFVTGYNRANKEIITTGQIELNNDNIILKFLPTSENNLPVGALWNNSGEIRIKI